MSQLSPGDRLGRYEIETPLGTGGMGEVYRARDTELGRAVAIKLIRSDFNQDPDRRDRFSREAQAVSRLTHPNICTLYDHGADGDLRYLVIEYLEGQTLADRLLRHPNGVPFEEAMSIAIAVGEGLAFAHRHKIVHRDVKPSNIMLTPVGVKLVDFGLALLREEPERGSDSFLSTAAFRTDERAVVGTLPYMAPEQFEGRADTRSDVFAFGALLYELLTGSRAFAGTSVTEVMAAILADKVPSVGSSLGRKQALLDRIIRKCLEKDPDRRWQSISDLTDELRWAAEPDSEPTQSDPSGRATPVTARRSPYMRALVAVGAAVLGAALVVIVVRGTKDDASVTPGFHLFFSPPPGTNFVPDMTGSGIAVSPDGSLIAFAAVDAGDSSLFLRQLGADEAKPLAGTVGARFPFFSPDSLWIGFFADGLLKKIRLPDGAPQIICAAPGGSVDWGVDGFIRFGDTGDGALRGISRVSEDGGEPEVLTQLNRERGETHHLAPQFLPATGALLYSARRVLANGIKHEIVMQYPGGGKNTILRDDALYGRAVGGRILLYQTGRTLLGARFDEKRGTILDAPIALPVELRESNYYESHWAAAEDAIVYVTGGQLQRRLAWVDRDGGVEPLAASPQPYNVPQLSPQGDRVAIEIPTGLDVDTWIYDLRTDVLSKFTFDGLNRYPMWTPDGLFLTVSRRRAGGHDIYWMEVDGSGNLRELLHAGVPTWVGSWSRDGRTLVYMQHSPETKSDLFAVEPLGEGAPRVLVQTPAQEFGGKLSPDGRWLAYFSDVSGRFELYLKPFARVGLGQQVSAEGAREAIWSRDGRELFFRNADRMLSVEIEPGESLAFRRPRVLFEGGYYQTGGPGIVNYDVSPDGQKFLMMEELEATTARIGVLNGFADRIPGPQ